MRITIFLFILLFTACNEKRQELQTGIEIIPDKKQFISYLDSIEISLNLFDVKLYNDNSEEDVFIFFKYGFSYGKECILKSISFKNSNKYYHAYQYVDTNSYNVYLRQVVKKQYCNDNNKYFYNSFVIIWKNGVRYPNMYTSPYPVIVNDIGQWTEEIMSNIPLNVIKENFKSFRGKYRQLKNVKIFFDNEYYFKDYNYIKKINIKYDIFK